MNLANTALRRRDVARLYRPAYSEPFQFGTVRRGNRGGMLRLFGGCNMSIDVRLKSSCLVIQNADANLNHTRLFRACER